MRRIAAYAARTTSTVALVGALALATGSPAGAAHAATITQTLFLLNMDGNPNVPARIPGVNPISFDQSLGTLNKVTADFEGGVYYNGFARYGYDIHTVVLDYEMKVYSAFEDEFGWHYAPLIAASGTVLAGDELRINTSGSAVPSDFEQPSYITLFLFSERRMWAPYGGFSPYEVIPSGTLTLSYEYTPAGQAASVAEPISLSLLGLGATAVIAARRRRPATA